MKLPSPHLNFTQKVLALSLLAAFGPVHADEAVELLIKPESTVSVGVAAVSGSRQDRSFFGQYTGMKSEGGYLLLDFDIVKRDDATGTWMLLKGNNLGLDNREVSASYIRQGDWKVSADYSELTRREPRTVNTGLQGAGTTTPSVVSLAAPGTGSELNLELKRKGITLSTDKWITPNLQFEASFKNEDKDGARIFGRGIACGVFAFQRNACGAAAGTFLASTNTAMLLLPEPVNSTTRQFEARLNYSGDNFLVSGGYYGSFYSNANGTLNPLVPGNLWNSNGSVFAAPGATLQGFLQQPMALPPDNQAHQFHLGGNYAFTPTTRATFKFAYTHATQDRDYSGSGLSGAPAGIGNLGGEVNTTLAQVGLTAKPVANLSLLANLRYEDKDDKTPLAAYNLTGLAANPANFFTNTQFSSRKLTGKAEANYQLPHNYRVTLGLDYQSIKRDRPVSTTVIDGLAALREDTREDGYRLEVRRSMSQTLNAGISYVSSRRDGSDWLSLTPGATVNSANGGFPTTLQDRRREKFKATADWAPIDSLSLQFLIEDGKDTYTAPGQKGLRDTGMNTYGIDAAWKVSEGWNLTGFVSRGAQTIHIDHSTGYLAELENINTTLGLGVRGKVSATFDVGADLSYTDDNNRYQQSMSGGTALIGGGLPDVNYRMTTLKLFGKYALDKDADLRFDLVHQRARLDEWSWGYSGVPFAYSDNTTVGLQPNQNATYIGATYIYRLK